MVFRGIMDYEVILDFSLVGIKRFDHETKVKVRSKRQNLQAALQLYNKQVGTEEINQIIESLLKVEYPKNSQNILNRNLRRRTVFCHKLYSVISPPNLRRFPRS